MKNYIYPLLLLFLCMACATENETPGNVVRFDPNSKEMIYEPQALFSSIQVISLHAPEDVIINTEGNFMFDGNRFYFVDPNIRKCVDIFDIQGEYIGSVAAQGRSETEYLEINSTQVIDSLVAIYSYHNKAVYYYDANGRFVKKDVLACSPRTVFKDKDHYWGYNGFANGQMPERVVEIDEKGIVAAKYLPSSAVIIPMSERATVFTSCDSLLLIRETLSDEIHAIDARKEVRTFLKFDFGKYSIPPTYFTQANPYDAATQLLSSDFATIDRFYINNHHAVVGVNFQFGSQEGRVLPTIGISDGDTWRWLKAEEEGPMSLFHSSLRGLTPDSRMILVAEKEPIEAFAKAHPDLVGQVEYSNDNPCLVLCKIKE